MQNTMRNIAPAVIIRLFLSCSTGAGKFCLYKGLPSKKVRVLVQAGSLPNVSEEH